LGLRLPWGLPHPITSVTNARHDLDVEPDYGEFGLPAAFEEDKGECALQASRIAGPQRGIFPDTEYAIWLSAYRQQFDGCMVGRGWVKR